MRLGLGMCNATYLAHAAAKDQPVPPLAFAVENTLCEDGEVKWLVVMLVDERAELGLNLEVDAAVLDLVEVLIPNDVSEEEVGHRP